MNVPMPLQLANKLENMRFALFILLRVLGHCFGLLLSICFH